MILCERATPFAGCFFETESQSLRDCFFSTLAGSSYCAWRQKPGKTVSVVSRCSDKNHGHSSFAGGQGASALTGAAGRQVDRRHEQCRKGELGAVKHQHKGVPPGFSQGVDFAVRCEPHFNRTIQNLMYLDFFVKYSFEFIATVFF